LDMGILDGVTRQHVLHLAKHLNMPMEEGRYRPADLLSADEMFVTNSVQEIVPVSEIDGHAVASTYGVHTRKLHTAYRESVATGS
jgi:4-amino-4-deoxychorismate lyase